ncbi:hypothetical protein [Nocardia pseudovaccinii]|uniref:hypothetical protein n=1 Tax=Nocardia pseudovaccinii TaxID=189540 RepID=UPI0007A5373F|nr:hypothetical protein [Nocardia pseudovaccinii]
MRICGCATSGIELGGEGGQGLDELGGGIAGYADRGVVASSDRQRAGAVAACPGGLGQGRDAIGFVVGFGMAGFDREVVDATHGVFGLGDH